MLHSCWLFAVSREDHQANQAAYHQQSPTQDEQSLSVGKSIRLEGYTVSNYFNLIPEFERDMTGWIHEGKVAWKETVVPGIENAPTAFLKLFKGENFGKTLVKLG